MIEFGSRRRRARRTMFDTVLNEVQETVLGEAQELLTDQLRDARSSASEAFQIMQVHSWKASVEILTGLLAIAKSQVARAEKKAPNIEKIAVE